MTLLTFGCPSDEPAKIHCRPDITRMSGSITSDRVISESRYTEVFYYVTNGIQQGSQTRGPRAECGPRGRFVRSAMLFGNFETFQIYVAKCLGKRCREINEPKLNDTQCGFHPGHSTTDQIFTLQQIFEKSWEYAKNVYTF